MDGVLADFEGKIHSLFPELLQLENGSQEKADKIDHFCQNVEPRIFLQLEPMEGAIKAWNILKDIYNVYLLSTPMWGCPESYTDNVYG